MRNLTILNIIQLLLTVIISFRFSFKAVVFFDSLKIRHNLEFLNEHKSPALLPFVFHSLLYKLCEYSRNNNVPHQVQRHEKKIKTSTSQPYTLHFSTMSQNCYTTKKLH